MGSGTERGTCGGTSGRGRKEGARTGLFLEQRLCAARVLHGRVAARAQLASLPRVCHFDFDVDSGMSPGSESVGVLGFDLALFCGFFSFSLPLLNAGTSVRVGESTQPSEGVQRDHAGRFVSVGRTRRSSAGPDAGGCAGGGEGREQDDEGPPGDGGGSTARQRKMGRLRRPGGSRLSRLGNFRGRRQAGR